MGLGCRANRLDHLTSALSELSERRSLREQARAIRLPIVLWVLLLSGGVATVVSSCVLGNESKWLHYCQVSGADVCGGGDAFGDCGFGEAVRGRGGGDLGCVSTGAGDYADDALEVSSA